MRAAWIGRIQERARREKVTYIRLADDPLAAEDKISKRRTLIAAKEKTLVAPDWPTESAAILVPLNAIGCGRSSKEILSVENRVAHEFEGISMEIVGAGLGDDVNDAARVRSILRAVVARLYAEFLERVRERKGLIDVRVFVHVIAAVELVADRILARAICRECDGARKGLRRALVGAAVGRVNGPRNQQRKLRRIPAIEGQFRNALPLDYLSQGLRSRNHLNRISCHSDDFRRHAQL